MPSSITSDIIKPPAPPRGGGYGGGGGPDGRGASRRASMTGLMVLLAATTMAFAAFTSAFVVRRGISNDWVALPLPRIVWVNTAVLLASSLLLELARRSLKSGRRTAFNRYWTAGTVLRALLLLGQAFAWRQLNAAGIFVATNPSSSFFYLLTAAHGLHIVGGLSALMYVDVQALRLRLGPGKRTAVDVSAVFWHFVDGLWLYLMALFLVWGEFVDVPRQFGGNPDLGLGRRGLALRREFEEVRDVAVHHLRRADILRAADGVYLRAAGHAQLAHAVSFFAQHHFFHRQDLLPALQQFDHGHGSARHESWQPQGRRRLDPGHHGGRRSFRRAAPYRVAEPDPQRACHTLRQPLGSAAVRRHVFRAHGIAHDSRRHRPDLPGNYRLCRGPRQIQGGGRGSKRSVLALCGPGVDVHLPAGLFDVGPYIAKP